MDASPRTHSLSFPIALSVAVAAAGITLLAALAVPQAWLESAVTASGAPALVAAAAPPLGLTARLLVALAAAGLIGVIAWASLYLVLGGRRIAVARPRRAAPRQKAAIRVAEEPTPVLRRADAHPDAPARRPIRAERDLGTPFLDIAAPAPAVASTGPLGLAMSGPNEELPLPADLNQPLAAFDPVAIPAEPLTPVRAVPSLAPRPAPLAPGERIDTFALAPTAPEEAPSLEALLARLEAHTRARRGRARPAPAHDTSSLEDSLGSLRRVAAHG